MSVAFVPPLMCSCCNRRRAAWRREGQDPEAQGIVAAVSAATGVSVTMLMSRNRTGRVAMARALVATRIHRELHYGPSEIGEILERDHSSVIAMIRKIDKVRRG